MYYYYNKLNCIVVLLFFTFTILFCRTAYKNNVYCPSNFENVRAVSYNEIYVFKEINNFYFIFPFK